MTPRPLVFFAPLVIVNLWHAFVVAIAKKRGTVWRTISESALCSTVTLRWHRVFHVFGAACFMIYGATLVGDARLRAAGILLIVAAVFDVIQVVVLSEKTNHQPMYLRDFHQATAWTMACGYLLFSLVYASQKGVASGVIAGYLLVLFVAYTWSALTKLNIFGLLRCFSLCLHLL